MNDCIFCKIIAGEVPSTKVYENEHVYAFLDIHPATPYHTLVIPKKHSVNIFDTPEDELREIISGVKKITAAYEVGLGIKNAQILNSSGPEAQQDVFHIHFHIVPRQTGDGQDIRWQKGEISPEQIEKISKLVI
jgi:histidine triad (HIT) family protein